MVEIQDATEIGGRLEDYITIAKEGKSITVEIALREQHVKQKSLSGEIGGDSIKPDTYLLFGDYFFEYEGKRHIVSKIYMYATLEESADATRITRNIANARLKMDYARLKAANIQFEEKYL